MDADETEMWAYGQGQWVIVDTLVRLTGKVKRIGYGHHTPALDDFPRSVINVQFVAPAKVTITQIVGLEEWQSRQDGLNFHHI